MLHKLSLRWRLTLMTAFLIGICCFGLTLVLNYSTYQLVNAIEATMTTPAVQADGTVIEAVPMLPLTPTEDAYQAKVEYSAESITYMILAVILGSALTYYVAGKALQPVKQLSEKVKRVNVNNLSNHLEVPQTQDEIAELTQSFNEMSGKLHDVFSMQKRFSINVAHELRTPLTVLQTKLDVFRKRKDHTPEEYDAFVVSLQKQTVRLRGLIKNLLDMTNVEDGELQQIQCIDLFTDIITELNDLAKAKEISLTLQCGQQSMIGNLELLYRAFFNLIENAMKYSKVGGVVEVMVKNDNAKNVVVSIMDDGIGIPDDVKQQVFEPFYRIDDARAHNVEGVGLGLSLVDAIIKKHHGHIEITNNKPTGTCFTITFQYPSKA